MAALFGGLSRRSHGGNRSSAPDPPDGIASLVPDAVEMGTTWVVSINQSQVQVPTGQGKYCRRCIEQEQTSPDRDQNIDHPAQRGADEDPAGVMTVQASSAQLSTEELQHIEGSPED